MKRFHVHVSVDDLDRSIAFYSGLFGAPPSVLKQDYAKWMVDDPRVNFAISMRGGETGINHLGLQAESAEELAGIRDAFSTADAASVIDEPGANCCYVRSDKHWLTDPQGIAWEGYHTLDEIAFFNGSEGSEATQACCTPAAHAAEQASATPSTSTSACCGPAATVAMPAAKERSTVCCGR